MSIPNSDAAPLEPVAGRIRALLGQRSELSELEKTAAVVESTVRLAHDLRNPLATIQAICGSLILETEDFEHQERLRSISAQVDKLASAVAVAVDRAADVDDAPAPVILGDLAHSLVDLLRYQSGDEVEFRTWVEPDVRCRLPERGLTRSLYQLLRNATAAVSGRGTGRIRLVCRRHGSHVAIEVADNGPGLPPGVLKRGPRACAAELPGSHLGLCSVERFARSLQGRLVLGSSETGGALVSMVLPVDCLDPGPPLSPIPWADLASRSVP